MDIDAKETTEGAECRKVDVLHAVAALHVTSVALADSRGRWSRGCGDRKKSEGCKSEEFGEHVDFFVCVPGWLIEESLVKTSLHFISPTYDAT